MVDIFGGAVGSRNGSRGPRGLSGAKGDKGDPGKSGIDDVCRWMPNIALNEFRRNESCCFTLTDPKKDLLVGQGGGYVKWLSKSKSKHDAIAVRASKHVLHISDKHNALIFDNSLYWVEDVILSLYNLHSYVCVCVTYQIEGESDQVIISNYDDDNPDLPFRAISASSKEIRIWGTKTPSSYISIKHAVGKMNGLLSWWNGPILMIIEVCLSSTVRIMEYLQVKMSCRWRKQHSRSVGDMVIHHNHLKVR